MRVGSRNRLIGVELAFCVFAAVLAVQPEFASAQSPATPSAEGAAPAPRSSEANSHASPLPPVDASSKPPPGVPSDASAVTLELTPRPVAYLSSSAEWANG